MFSRPSCFQLFALGIQLLAFGLVLNDLCSFQEKGKSDNNAMRIEN